VIQPTLQAKAGALEATLSDLTKEHPTRLSGQTVQQIRAAGIEDLIIGHRVSKKPKQRTSDENPMLDASMREFEDSPAKSRMLALDAM